MVACPGVIFRILCAHYRDVLRPETIKTAVRREIRGALTLPGNGCCGIQCPCFIAAGWENPAVYSSDRLLVVPCDTRQTPVIRGIIFIGILNPLLFHFKPAYRSRVTLPVTGLAVILYTYEGASKAITKAKVPVGRAMPSTVPSHPSPGSYPSYTS